MFNDATVRYLIKQKKKSRYITTYKNNIEGKKLRSEHKYFTNYINDNYYDKINTPFSYAYLKNKSPKLLVQKHLNNNYFLYLDIKKFFESIDLNILEEKTQFLVNKNFSKENLSKLIKSCKVPKKDNGLAIGLIPSSLFSNIYLQEFDISVNNFLKGMDNNFVYTRYSDDIVISLNNSFEFNKIIKYINTSLKTLKLTLHNEKLLYKHLDKQTDHIKVLGLNIVKGKTKNYITVSRRYKKEVNKKKNYFIKRGMISYISYNQK